MIELPVSKAYLKDLGLMAEDVPMGQITCPRCGCVVGNHDAHSAWHQKVDRLVRSAGTWDAALKSAMKDLTG